MQLEDLLTRIADSLDRNSAALEALNKKAGGAAPAATAAATKATGKATTKPAGKGTSKKTPTVDDIAEAFGNYLKGGDPETRAEAKTNVKAILNHFGVERASHIDAADFPEALRYLKQFQAGQTPDFMNEDGDEDDDGEAPEDLM